MKKIAFFSDILFTLFVAFVFSLLFFRYLRIELHLAVLLAAVCGSLVALSVGAYLRSKRKNIFLKKSEALQKEKFLLHLALSGNEANAEFFRKLFYTQNPSVETKRTGKNRLTTAEAVYFMQFTFAPVSADDIAPFTRLKTHRKKVLLCNRADETAVDVCRRFNIQITAGDKIFNVAKTANALPEHFLGEENADNGKKRAFKLWFAKSNSRRFLLSAVLILLLARITPFYYYYVAFGVVLLFAAVFTRIFGKE